MIDLTVIDKYITIDGRFGHLELGRHDVADPLGFAIAVARAAISEAPAPEITSYELLG